MAGRAGPGAPAVAAAAGAEGATGSETGAAGGPGSVGASTGAGSGAEGVSSFSRRKRRKRDIFRSEGPGALKAPAGAPGFSAGSAGGSMADPPSARLRALGLELPPPPRPAGSYAPVVVDGHRAWVSGQVVTEAGVAARPGLVDRDVPADVARDLARRATLQALSALAAALGSIDRVRRVLRVGVFVASSPGFSRQHEIANGASELLIELFGESGRPARAAVGVAGLPLNAPVEVELTVALDQ